MKKLLAFPIVFLAASLSFGQRLHVATGTYGQITITNPSDSVTLFALDTVNGLRTPKLYVTNKITTDSITQTGGTWFILSNGSADFADGAFAIKANGTGVMDSILSAYGLFSGVVRAESLLTTEGAVISGNLHVGDTVKSQEIQTFSITSQPVIGADPNGLFIPTPTVGTTDTIPQTDWVRSLLSTSGVPAPPSWVSGTTYSINAIASQNISSVVYYDISNVGSNVGNTPGTSTTAYWTVYNSYWNFLTAVLNLGLGHP